MKLEQWFALANFSTQSLPEKMELLLERRAELFDRQDELLQRQMVLAHQKQELCDRQTAHELQSRLFWLELRRATTEQRDEAYLQ